MKILKLYIKSILIEISELMLILLECNIINIILCDSQISIKLGP